MDIQHSQNQDEIEKLRLKNEELKKNLEREQLLHSMLYKEWKELSEQASARENEFYHNKSKNVFYKYAFFVLLICMIPAYYFFAPGRGNEKTAPSSSQVATTEPAKDSSVIKDSTPITKDSMPTNKNTAITQPAVQTPVVQPEEKKAPRDTIKPKMVTLTRHVSEAPLDSSSTDSIYWMGWNAYFNKSSNHFRKSSEKYKVWMQGFNDGHNDARKLLAQKDSLNKQK